MRRFLLFLLLVSVLPLAACGGMGASSSSTAAGSLATALENKQWQAVSIFGKSVELFAGQAVPHILFFDVSDAAGRVAGAGATARVAGSDGCNRLIGSAQFNGSTLTFPPMGSTMMACPFGFEQSVAFKKALAETTAHRKAGDTLELLAGEKVVLVLTPVAVEQ